MKTGIKIGDFIIIILVAMLAVSVLIACRFYLFSDKGNELLARSDEGTATYSMMTNDTFTLKSGGYTMKVCISDGSAYVAECNCPDKICVNTGKISKSGQSIVCVPAGISLTVKAEKGEIDIVGG